MNGNEKEWENPSGNPMGMGISYKIGNGNGKEWELTAWEWKGMRVLKIFLVISTCIQYLRWLFTTVAIYIAWRNGHVRRLFVCLRPLFVAFKSSLPST